MATELTDYVRVYDDVVSKDVCQSILTAIQFSDSEYIDREQRPSFKEINISQKYIDRDPYWVSIQEELNSIFSDITKRYISDLDVGPDFPSEYAFEQFRAKSNENNNHDQFKDHVDVGNHASAKRFLVMFLYLNTVEVGGGTNFPRLDLTIQPKCGRILVFPPTWQYRHAGLPPVSETKHIIGSYLHYL